MNAATKKLRLIVALASALAAVACAGCHRRVATADDCRAVLDRLITLELAESGYRDPVLAARWNSDLSRRLAPDLDRCVGKRVPIDLRACLPAARTPEEIAHHCLK